jgi:hypothetical protein
MQQGKPKSPHQSTFLGFELNNLYAVHTEEFQCAFPCELIKRYLRLIARFNQM